LMHRDFGNCICALFKGETAVCINRSVYFGHKPNGFRKGGNYVLVMGQIVKCELAAFAVFEPLLTDLITADVE